MRLSRRRIPCGAENVPRISPSSNSCGNRSNICANTKQCQAIADALRPILKARTDFGTKGSRFVCKATAEFVTKIGTKASADAALVLHGLAQGYGEKHGACCKKSVGIARFRATECRVRNARE